MAGCVRHVHTRRTQLVFGLNAPWISRHESTRVIRDLTRWPHSSRICCLGPALAIMAGMRLRTFRSVPSETVRAEDGTSRVDRALALQATEQPEGGDRGGKVIATGTPEQVAAKNVGYTGKYIAKMLEQK